MDSKRTAVVIPFPVRSQAQRRAAAFVDQARGTGGLSDDGLLEFFNCIREYAEAKGLKPRPASAPTDQQLEKVRRLRSILDEATPVDA